MVALPRDFTHTLPSECKIWLDKYGVTSQEITDNNFGWSESLGYLIFPFFGVDGLIGYVARKFKGDGPKYLTKGIKENFIATFGTADTIVFTEDLISAIIVGRVCSSCCLFGTYLSPKKLAYLKGYNKYIIWLDNDKRQDSLKQVMKYKQYGYNISNIYTDKDPKEYSNKEIEELISD